jgi:hypothetical protein
MNFQDLTQWCETHRTAALRFAVLLFAWTPSEHANAISKWDSEDLAEALYPHISI